MYKNMITKQQIIHAVIEKVCYLYKGTFNFILLRLCHTFSMLLYHLSCVIY